MSIEAYKWAKEVSGLTPHEKWLLVSISDYYNDKEKRAWPSRNELSKRTSMSVRTITRQLSSLESKGWILIERWFNNNTGKNLSNRYYLPKFDSESGNNVRPNSHIYAEVDRDPRSGKSRFTDV